MGRGLLLVAIIAGVAGVAGLILTVLCRAVLKRPTDRRLPSGYRKRDRRLRLLRDAGLIAAILGMVALLVIAAWCWMQMGRM